MASPSWFRKLPNIASNTPEEVQEITPSEIAFSHMNVEVVESSATEVKVVIVNPNGTSKGPFTQAIFVAATRCNFVALKLNQVSNIFETLAISRRQIALPVLSSKEIAWDYFAPNRFCQTTIPLLCSSATSSLKFGRSMMLSRVLFNAEITIMQVLVDADNSGLATENTVKIMLLPKHVGKTAITSLP